LVATSYRATHAKNKMNFISPNRPFKPRKKTKLPLKFNYYQRPLKTEKTKYNSGLKFSDKEK